MPFLSSASSQIHCLCFIYFASNGTNVTDVKRLKQAVPPRAEKASFSAEAALTAGSVSCGTTGKDSLPVEYRSNGSFTEVVVTLSAESPHVNPVGVRLWPRESNKVLGIPSSQLGSPGWPTLNQMKPPVTCPKCFCRGFYISGEPKDILFPPKQPWELIWITRLPSKTSDRRTCPDCCPSLRG